jgi:hypothetical protein
MKSDLVLYKFRFVIYFLIICGFVASGGGIYIAIFENDKGLLYSSAFFLFSVSFLLFYILRVDKAIKRIKRGPRSP